jgi:hypothetical protein
MGGIGLSGPTGALFCNASMAGAKQMALLRNGTKG